MKIKPEEIEGLSEGDADAMLEVLLKRKERIDKEDARLRRYIGMLHARLNWIAKIKSMRNG
jgi:hypothetical protein